MSASPDRHPHTMLPSPDRPPHRLTTYGAKDPDTALPPIEPLLPPGGAPNLLVMEFAYHDHPISSEERLRVVMARQ